MEITIDLEFVRAILRREYGQAREEIRSMGASRALASSQARHDARLASAPDVGTLDCRTGCSWCCHFSVDVRAVEVFAIVEHVERSFSDDQKARVRAEVSANSSLLRGLDEVERMMRNVKCPFLVDSRCGIYELRPQTCRNYHATDVTGCQRSYEEPGNLDIDPDFAPWVYQAGAAHVDGFSRAMRDEGRDVDAYELNQALDAAFAAPGARARFEAGLPPFPGLEGEEVPSEFDDLEVV